MVEGKWHLGSLHRLRATLMYTDFLAYGDEIWFVPFLRRKHETWSCFASSSCNCDCKQLKKVWRSFKKAFPANHFVYEFSSVIPFVHDVSSHCLCKRRLFKSSFEEELVCNLELPLQSILGDVNIHRNSLEQNSSETFRWSRKRISRGTFWLLLRKNFSPADNPHLQYCSTAWNRRRCGNIK